MLLKKRLLLAVGLAGVTLFGAGSANAFWGPFNPWNWGDGWGPGWGNGWGGPWYGPGYYGYPGYWGGYPGYYGGYPYAYGGVPYGYAYPGYGYPAPAAPTASTSSE
ncbi:MAG: sulfur globule protein CV3 [Halochromatium sp.]